MAQPPAPPKPVLRFQATIDDFVQSLAWNADGSRLAVASVSGPISIFDADGKRLHLLTGHGMGTSHIAWHPKKSQFASIGQDGTARIWDGATCIHELKLGTTWGERLAWHPKGETLITVAGKRLRAWSADGTLLREYPEQSASILDVAWMPKGKEFVTGGPGGIAFWNTTADLAVRKYPWGSAALMLAIAPTGDWIAAGGQDASVHVWRAKSGDDLEMNGYPRKVRELAWDRTGTYLATGGGEQVLVWNCSGDGPAGTTPMAFKVHVTPVTALAFQATRGLLVSGCESGTVAFWLPGGSKKLLARFDLGSAISQLGWSPRDTRLAVGTASGEVVVYAV